MCIRDRLTPELEAQLSGGTFDETTKVYSFKTNDTAPEFAFGYAALKLDGTYRMFKHYVVKLMSVSVSHSSKGDSGDIQAYELTLRSTQRQADGKVRDIKDSEDASYEWLGQIEQYPAVSGE